MASRDETEWLILGGLWLWAQAREAVPRAIKAVERGGAAIYEATHPASDHDRDLPGTQWTRAHLQQLASQVGFADPKVAAAIALAESGGVPHALGDGGKSIGLWQINLTHHPQFSRENMLDPLKNARAAFAISRGGKQWKWWTTYNTGAYRKYL